MKRILAVLIAIVLALGVIPFETKTAQAYMEVTSVGHFGYADIDDVLSSIFGGTGNTGSKAVDRAPSVNQQGWVLYIIDENANIVSDAYAITNSADTSWQNYTYTLSNGYLNTRFGNVKPTFVTGKFEIPDSYVKSGSLLESNYQKVRSEVKGSDNNKDKNANCQDLITSYFGTEFCETKWKSDTSYYLILEPFYWHGLHNEIVQPGSTPTASKTKTITLPLKADGSPCTFKLDFMNGKNIALTKEQLTDYNAFVQAVLKTIAGESLLEKNLMGYAEEHGATVKDLFTERTADGNLFSFALGTNTYNAFMNTQMDWRNAGSKTLTVSTTTGETSGSTYEYNGQDICATVYRAASLASGYPAWFKGVWSYQYKNHPIMTMFEPEGGAMKDAPGYPFGLNLPSAAGLEYVKNGTSYITSAEVLNTAYGIACFWNHDDSPTYIPHSDNEYGIGENSQNAKYVPSSLYETMFYDEGNNQRINNFDISEAIPSSEKVTNEINCAAFVGIDY